jgi:hypothetical protein
MIPTVTALPYVTHAKQHRAKFFCSTKIRRHTHHAVTSHRDIEILGFICSPPSDMACRVRFLHPSHLPHSSFPDRETSPVRKTGFDLPSRVYNGGRCE